MGWTVWKNEAGRARLESWYARFTQRITAPVEQRPVATRFGDNSLLIAGSPDRPPLICLHPMRTGAPFLLSELGPAMQHFRLIAPDLPGQSVRGPQVRAPIHGDDASGWLLDVLDGLNLASADVFGVSWGGFVARTTASAAPERIRRLALLVPAGIVNGSHLRGLTRMAWPMLRYRLHPSEDNLRAFLSPLLTTWDDDWARFMADSLVDMTFDMRIPPPATDDDFRRLTMPVLAIGASDDISFPGDALVRRMKAMVPHADTEIITSKHSPPTTDAFREWLATRLARFFADLGPT